MVLQRIAAARERSILSHAKPCLADGEVVEEWVRIRHPEHRGSGFIYLTTGGCVVYWSGISSNPVPFRMDEIQSWGVDRSSEKGPVLGIETEDSSQFVQLIVGTDGMVDKANAFLDKFAQHAPIPQGPLQTSSHPSDYESTEGLKVDILLVCPRPRDPRVLVGSVDPRSRVRLGTGHPSLGPLALPPGGRTSEEPPRLSLRTKP